MDLRNKQNFYAAEAKKNFEQKVIIRQFSSLSQSVDIFDLQCREGPTSQSPMRSSVAATNAQRVPSSTVYVIPSHGSTLSRHVTISTTCLNICNKPGPAQVGAISKAQNSKKTSKCQVLFYSTRKSKYFEKKSFEKSTY